MTSLLSRISIRWKVAINPAILTLLLIASGLSAIWMMDANQQRTSALMAGPIVDAQKMQMLATKTWSVQARLYRLVATVASETDADKIAAETKSLAEQVAGVEAASRPRDDAKLQELWDRYFKLVKGVVDMADTDAGSAMMLMMGVTRAFDALDADIEKRLSATAKRESESIASLEEYVGHAKTVLGAAILAAVAIAVAVSVVIASDIAKPLRAAMAAMSRLSHGDYQTEVPGAGRRDELGEMGRTLLVFRSNLVEAQKLRADQRDNEARTARQRHEELQNLANRFERVIAEVVRSVSSAATNLEQSAQSLAESASAGQQQAAQVEEASDQTAQNVQSVATATAQLGTSVGEISRQVHESAAIASEAVQQASRTDIRVNELSEAAARVGSVVELIASIASQTNLLALNATIEAARAGEAGRGFAVVAEEVKTLAGQTAKATSDIGNQIARMRGATEDAVTTIRDIGSTITRMAAIASAISAAVEEQEHVTQDISRNVQGATDGTTRVAGNIAELRGTADATGSASAHLLGAARSLTSSSSRLGDEVEKFLSTVRAA